MGQVGQVEFDSALVALLATVFDASVCAVVPERYFLACLEVSSLAARGNTRKKKKKKKKIEVTVLAIRTFGATDAVI